MNGGTLSSFEIDSDYVMDDVNKTSRKIKYQEQATTQNVTSVEKQVKSSKKRDRLEIVHGLLVKLVDESDAGGQGFADEDFFINLEDDEIEVIKEIIDEVSWWVEIVGPCVVVALPIVIWFIRQRIHASRLLRYQNQIDRI